MVFDKPSTSNDVCCAITRTINIEPERIYIRRILFNVYLTHATLYKERRAKVKVLMNVEKLSIKELQILLRLCSVPEKNIRFMFVHNIFTIIPNTRSQ